MNAGGVPLEARYERSGGCFGGFRPLKHVEEPWALARGAPRWGVKELLRPIDLCLFILLFL